MTLAMDVSPDLPEGWSRAAIRDVFKLNPPKPSANELESTTEVAFVPMPAVDADAGAITNPLVRTFAEVRKGFTSFRDNDVILAKITPCFENGKSAICRGLLNGLGFGSTEFHVLRCMGAVLPEYIYHYARQESFRREGAEKMTGSVGQKRVPADWISNVELPVPPLAEQRRIVAKVEELLARVNAARHRLAKVPIILKRFRQSVLATACSGQLTADWRNENKLTAVNIQSIETLRWAKVEATIKANSPLRPKKYLPVSVEIQPPTLDIPSTWAWVRPRHIADSSNRYALAIGPFGSSLKVDDYRSEGVPLVFVRNIRSGNFDDSKFVSKKKATELDAHMVVGGDVLVTKMGDPPGDTRCYPSSRVNAIITADCLKLTPEKKLVSSQFLEFAINSYNIRSQIVDLTMGVAQPKISLERFETVAIPLPPLVEQLEIVRRVETLFTMADKIESRLHAATARVEKITQAILTKAFRGELVPTEAELARQEGRDYEPASVLLDRIRAHRATESNGKSNRHRRPTRPSNGFATEAENKVGAQS